MFDINLTKDELLDIFDRLEGRVDLLDNEERIVVRLFQSVRDFRCIGQTAEVHEATIARRLRKIAQRISDDKFVSAIAGDDKVLRGKFMYGKSIRQIANGMGLSRYRVEKIVNNTERRTSNIQH